jgi:hypothetical protein
MARFSAPERPKRVRLVVRRWPAAPGSATPPRETRDGELWRIVILKLLPVCWANGSSEPFGSQGADG